MFTLPLNYTEIIEREGAEILFDPHSFGLKKRQLCEAGETLQAIFELLKSRELDATPAKIAAVAFRGGEAVREQTLSSTRAQLAKADLPLTIREAILKMATAEMSADVLAAADDLCREYLSKSEGLPLNIESQVTIADDKLVIDTEAVEGTIRQGCEFAVPAEMAEEAKGVEALAEVIQGMELKGLNCLELVGKYAGAKDYTRLDLLRDIVTRRHQPGQMTPADISTYVNMTPLQR
ncbi:MAG: hypothetical protein IKH00_04605 [Bacteroidales bacterium]|nr:hypothetical protein [Bacteroidales bacterium]